MKSITLFLFLLISCSLSAQSFYSDINQELKEALERIERLNSHNQPTAGFRTNPVKRLDSTIYIAKFQNPNTVQNDFKYRFQYDAFHNVVESRSYARQNASFPWEFRSQQNWEYDVNNNVVDHISRDGSMNTSNVFMNGVRLEYIYDNDNQVVDERRSNYSNYSGIWSFQSRELSTYNSSGLLLEILLQDWNSGQWEDGYKETYAYDSNNLLVSELAYIVNGGNWEPYSKTDHAYNSTNQLVESIAGFYEDTIGVWTNVHKIEYWYTPAGLLNGAEVSIWSAASWTSFNRVELLFDSVDNLTATTYYEWDSALQGWILNRTEQSTYDNNFPYAVLATSMEEINCRHLLLTSTAELINTSTGQIRFFYDITYFWSDIMTGIEQMPNESAQISFYPNPATNFLEFDLPTSNVDSSIELFNANGQRLLQQPLLDNRLLLPELPLGVYLFLISQDGKLSSGKVMVE